MLQKKEKKMLNTRKLFPSVQSAITGAVFPHCTRGNAFLLSSSGIRRLQLSFSTTTTPEYNKYNYIYNNNNNNKKSGSGNSSKKKKKKKATTTTSGAKKTLSKKSAAKKTTFHRTSTVSTGGANVEFVYQDEGNNEIDTKKKEERGRQQQQQQEKRKRKTREEEGHDADEDDDDGNAEADEMEGEETRNRRSQSYQIHYRPIRWSSSRESSLFVPNTGVFHVDSAAKSVIARNYEWLHNMARALRRHHNTKPLWNVASPEWQKRFVSIAILWGDANALLTIEKLMREVFNRPDMMQWDLRALLLHETFTALHREGDRQADIRELYNMQQTDAFRNLPWSGLIKLMFAGYLVEDADSGTNTHSTACRRADEQYHALVDSMTHLCREGKVLASAAQSFLSDAKHVLLSIYLANQQFDRAMEMLRKEADPAEIENDMANGMDEYETKVVPSLKGDTLGKCLLAFGAAVKGRKIDEQSLYDVCNIVLFKIASDTSVAVALPSLAIALSSNEQMDKFFDYMGRLVSERAYEFGISSIIKTVGEVAKEGMFDSCVSILNNIERYGLHVGNGCFIAMMKGLSIGGHGSFIPRVLHIMRQMNSHPDISLLREVMRIYEENGDLHNALELKNGMSQLYDIAPDSEIYRRLIRLLIEHGQPDVALKQLREMQHLHGIQPSGALLKTVVDSLCRTNRLSDAQSFLEIFSVQLADTHPRAFHNVIAALIQQQHQQLDNAVHVFKLMKSMGALARMDNPLESFDIIITALITAKRQEQAISYLMDMVDMDLVPSLSMCNKLLNAFIDNTAAVEQILSVMRHYQIKPDEHTHAIYIKHVLHTTNNIDDAMNMFEDMEKSRSLYDTMIFSLLRHERIDEAKALLHKMKEDRFDPRSSNYRPFLLKYASIHDDEGVRETLSEMRQSGLHLDVSCYNALMFGYRKAQNEHKVLHWFDEMQLAGVQGDDSTYNAVMLSLVKLGRMRQGIEMFKNTVKPNGLLNSHTFKIMIAAYMKLGDVDGLKNTVIEMVSQEDVKLSDKERNRNLATVSQWLRGKGLKEHLDELEHSHGIVFPRERLSDNKEQKKERAEEEVDDEKGQQQSPSQSQQHSTSTLQFPDDVLRALD